MTRDPFPPPALRAPPGDIDHGRPARPPLDLGRLFPAEQARIVQLLVERVVIESARLNVRLRIDGLAALAQEMTADLQQAA